MFLLYYMFFINCFFFALFTNAYNYDDEGWTKAANFLKEGYNASAVPCEDFTNFACGKWLKGVGRTQGSTIYNHYRIVYKQLQEAVEEIDIEDKKLPQFKRSVRTFFSRCTESLELNGTETVVQLFDIVVKKLGVPPILTSDKKKKEKILAQNVWHVLGQTQRELPVAEIFFKPDTLTFEDQCRGNFPVLSFKPLIYDQSRLDPQAVFKHTAFLAKVLNIKINAAEMTEKIAKMVEFDNELVEFYNVTEQAVLAKANANAQANGKVKVNPNARANGKAKANTNAEANEMEASSEEEKILSLEQTISLEQLEKHNPNISWSNYFQGLFSTDQYDNWNQSAPVLYIDDITFFDNLDNVIRKVDVETVYNYIFYRAMRTYYDQVKIAINETETTTESECIKQIIELFKSASSRILFDHFKYDHVEWRHDISLMYETIVSAFRFLVAGSDWLDYEDKMAVIEKANGIRFYPGIPEWFNNDTEIDDRTIPINPEESLLQNFINLLHNNFDKDLDYVVGLRTFAGEEEPQLEINAYYQAMQVWMKLGYALPPWYSPKYPLAVKYGHLGYTLGHEIMHGYDAERVNEVPSYLTKWLKPETLKTFTRKRDCLIKQYSSYCFKSHKQCLSGRKTITENMADIDGLKIAYMAYKFAIQTIGDEPPLPGFLDLTGDQIFFLTAARTHCTTGIEVQGLLKDEDEHAPDQARIDVPFRNFPVFAKLFKCQIGSEYAPLKTCSVWGSFNAGNKLNRW